jgi:hypothetical protein
MLQRKPYEKLHMAAKWQTATVRFALGLFDTNAWEDRIMNILATSNRWHKTWAKASARVASGLLASCLGVSALSAQVSQPQKSNADLQPFVGTWQAKFKGTIFQTIKLAVREDKVTGTISHANVDVDPKSGDLTGVDLLDGSDAVVEAKLTSGILRITEEDGMQFDMKVLGPDLAEIRLVVPAEAASKVSTPKPWKLERAKVAK